MQPEADAQPTHGRPTHGRATPDLQHVLDHARSLEMRVYQLDPRTWAWLHGRLQWRRVPAAAVLKRERMADFTLDVYLSN
jgi:hypothetical protein